MPDDLKRRPSKRIVRRDDRAEPDSVPAPAREDVVTRPRRGQSVPAPRTKAPQTPESGDAGSVSALRRQVATLQLELAEVEQKLGKTQAEREEDADRLSDMLARLNKMGEEVRAAEERANKAEALAASAREKADIDDEGARAANDALADAERRAAEELDKLARLTAELDGEKETSRWLRTAGEQTTREAAALRARLAEEEAKAHKEREEAAFAHRAVVEELAASAARLVDLEHERRSAVRDLAALREEHATHAATEESTRQLLLDEARASHAAELDAVRGRAQKALDDARREGAEALESFAARTAPELEEARNGRRAAEEQKEALERALDETRAAEKDASRLRSEVERELTLAKAAQTEAERAKETLQSQLDEARAATTETARLKEEAARELGDTRDALHAAKAKILSLEEALTVAAADADRALAAVRAERDEAERKGADALERASQANSELADTTQRLAGLRRALEALENTETEVQKLRSQATASRHAALEHATAMVAARDRASRPTGQLELPDPRPSEVDGAWGDGDDDDKM